MPTIDHKPIIDTLIANNGYFEGDPQALAIFSYVNDWDKETYFIAYTIYQVDSLFTSPHCRDIKSLWKRKGL